MSTLNTRPSSTSAASTPPDTSRIAWPSYWFGGLNILFPASQVRRKLRIAHELGVPRRPYLKKYILGMGVAWSPIVAVVALITAGSIWLAHAPDPYAKLAAEESPVQASPVTSPSVISSPAAQANSGDATDAAVATPDSYPLPLPPNVAPSNLFGSYGNDVASNSSDYEGYAREHADTVPSLHSGTIDETFKNLIATSDLYRCNLDHEFDPSYIPFAYGADHSVLMQSFRPTTKTLGSNANKAECVKTAVTVTSVSNFEAGSFTVDYSFVQGSRSGSGRAMVREYNQGWRLEYNGKEVPPAANHR